MVRDRRGTIRVAWRGGVVLTSLLCCAWLCIVQAEAASGKSAPTWVEVRPVSVKQLKMPKAHAKAQARRRRALSSTRKRPLPFNHPPIRRPKAGGKLDRKMVQSFVGIYLKRAQRSQKDGLRLTKDQQLRARGLADMIIAPCCYTQPVSLHGNKVAEAVKMTLRQLVVLGYADDIIKAAFVSAYGKRVLSVPDNKIFVIPVIIAFLVLVFVCFLVWRWYRRSEEGGGPPMGDTPEESQA